MYKQQHQFHSSQSLLHYVNAKIIYASFTPGDFLFKNI